ncbi:DNA-nicking endonuclease, Smr domain [Paracoccus halophilus]|uniref:DNA mismatch repair protein MutS n=1 Tax=Paracoccus halophilus TaxID=376733 RepID=A0A099F5G1_9RHOB|nr:Smr/MutS family protein [Paracoccus halophilus]KGJ05684.1 DNA mismatch repair protein MutS [Paracoccus halophilus]SFA47892.1 DNA-nicking endonuclease, Smr domain [Paracoccus halophilus]
MARRRGLSAEEKALWSRIAATALPLHPARKRAGSAAQSPPDPMPAPKEAPPAPEQPPQFKGLRLSGRLNGGGSSMNLSPQPRDRLGEQPLRMDHKTHRQMTRGKLAPEARIDLHGMTLAVAQPALTSFIMRAYAEGRRLVLVITGKGRAGGPDAPLPVRPGALRHHVPHWLQMPPLGGIVLQIRAAHRRHGGDGAYYVYLRR